MGHQGTQPPLSLREPKVRGNLSIRYNYSIDEFFSFLFLYLLLVVNSFSFLWMNKLLVVVDCFTSFAMTKGKRGSEFFFFSVFALTFCGLWIASSFYSSQWQHTQTRHCESQPTLVIARANPHSSLRELLATRGNLGIEHYDSQTKLVIAKDSGEEWITVSSAKSHNEGLRITRLPWLF